VKDIACGFNLRTTSISTRIIGLVNGLLKMSIDTFPVVETGYISNIAIEKHCQRKTLPSVSTSGLQVSPLGL
jgi:hypothetical protein